MLRESLGADHQFSVRRAIVADHAAVARVFRQVGCRPIYGEMSMRTLKLASRYVSGTVTVAFFVA
jgi:hypothetical protein